MPSVPVASTSTSGTLVPPSSALVPPTNAFTTLSLGARPSNSKPKLKARFDKWSSNLDDLAKRLKPRIPDAGVFLATMTGLPIVRDAVSGVQVVQDWTSCRQKLQDFAQKLERLLAAIESHSNDPGYMTLTMEEFKSGLESILDRLDVELSRQGSYYSSATRLLELADEYEQKAMVLMEEALVSGIFAQQTIVLPEEYDKTIPILKSLHKGNGLVITKHIGTDRIDGGPTETAPVEHMHIMTHQGTYKDTLVEIKEYFGGPEDVLLQEVQDIVDHHQTFKNNPNIPELFGGSVDRMPDGQVCAHLVFAPAEGEPWIDVAKARQSVELLCQVAEKTMQAFEYLKMKKQMNWENIKIRPDGTLTIVPSTQGDKFLIDEEVWDPMDLPEDMDMSWPIKELFELLQESAKQGITRNAVAALRAHDGPWDKIAVWKVAKRIGLRPAEQQMPWFRYPPNDWKVHTGMIISREDEDAVSFDQLDMMPKQGLTGHDREHLRQFMMLNAVAQTEGGELIKYRNEEEENWLERTPDGEWEFFTLEPCEDLEWIQLDYESSRLDKVPWEQWKIILELCAKRRNKELDNLAVVVRTEGTMSLHKRDCPELGTRPLYFYRKSNQATASPREFWGFFSFNPDPKGSPGINVRVNERGMGCAVSDSMPAQPRGWTQSQIEVEFRIAWVSIRDDWNNKIEDELERQRLNPFPMYEEHEVDWSDEDDEMDDSVWQ